MERKYCAQRAPRASFAGKPTGFRRLTQGLLKANRAADAFTGLPEGVNAPGQLLAAFKAAAPRLGLSIRLVHAVDWLFRFTQPQDWEEGGRPIVWPSAETQQAALSLSPTQVKAINRLLIEAGLLTMRDSPNGKRFGNRDRQGRITEAYGFDLAPLAARHADFLRLAEEERQERQELGRLRRKATIARKGITQILETVHEYGLQGEEWVRLAEETQHLIRLLKDAGSPADMTSGVVSLERRQTAAREHLEALLGTVDSAPLGPENRPHNTTTNESYNLSDTVIAPEGSSRSPAEPPLHPSPSPAGQIAAATVGLNLTPGELVRLAPRLKDYLRGPDPTWRDVVDAADWVRNDLGISKPAWGEACLLLGREGAAIAVAIVSTKAPGYFKTAPGGYFRGMLDKAKAHDLNLDRTIWKLRGGTKPVSGTSGPGTGKLVNQFSRTTYPRPSAGATARVGEGVPRGG
jgi:replication initiation protein RepC